MHLYYIYVVEIKINRHILLFTVYYVQCAFIQMYPNLFGLLICPRMRHRGPSFILITYLSNFIFSGGLYITNHAIPSLPG
jgi:hypothetical protein